MKWEVWFRRRRWEQRMDAEFRFHLDSQISDYMSQGFSRDEAERRARSEFGALELTKDECRDQRPLEWLDHFLRDVRYAGRSLRRNLGFAATVVLTLALGVGANTAIFSVVYSVLLRPLPYSAPGEIYSVQVVIPERRSQFASLPVTVQTYLAWRKSETAFAAMSALRPWECNVTGDGEPERLGGALVSANFFSFLGASITHGRGFYPGEEQPGNEKVVVISDALWRRRYGSDPSLIGKTISINGQQHLVVGIAPPGLLVPTGTTLHPQVPFAPRVDLWKPIAPTKKELESESWDHGLLVRLRPGAQPEVGRQQLEAIQNALFRQQLQGTNTRLEVELVPIREVYAGKVRLRLLLILAASGLLLLTACTNIANLSLARMASRLHEFATRTALGASRARILSQIWAETIVLAIGGGVLGTVIAWFGARVLTAQAPNDLQLLTGTQLHMPVLLFASALSLFASFACGTLPAWWQLRRDAVVGLQESARNTLGGGRAVRTRHLIVGVQMAMGTALLASAGLLLHSFVNVMGADRGYYLERVLAVDLSLYGPRQDAAGFYSQLAENTRTLPGVLAAGVINDLPAVAGSTGASRTIFHVADKDYQNLVLHRPVAMIRSITPGYLSASGTVLQAGRSFNSQENSPVALISESLATRLWPQDPPSAAIGRQIRQGDVNREPITIVGVVQNVQAAEMDRELPPFIYRPYPQWASGPATLVLRTAQEPSAIAPAVRAEIRKLNANLPIPAMRTMREIVSASVAQRRFQMALTSVFALLALLLGAVGVYGVLSYYVTCRTREIGLRLALGAMKSDVLGWIFASGMRPVVIGLIVGLAGSVAAAIALRSLLFGISPVDPISLSFVVLVLLSTSGLACYLPARRAAQMDPINALRHE